jgi:hypothetical protein
MAAITRLTMAVEDTKLVPLLRFRVESPVFPSVRFSVASLLWGSSGTCRADHAPKSDTGNEIKSRRTALYLPSVVKGDRVTFQ